MDAEERLLYGLCYAARPKTPMSPLWPCRQQQQEAAARLCMLEGMLFDSEDTFMEQAHRAYAWCIYGAYRTRAHVHAHVYASPSWSRLAARASLT